MRLQPLPRHRRKATSPRSLRRLHLLRHRHPRPRHLVRLHSNTHARTHVPPLRYPTSVDCQKPRAHPHQRKSRHQLRQPKFLPFKQRPQLSMAPLRLHPPMCLHRLPSQLPRSHGQIWSAPRKPRQSWLHKRMAQPSKTACKACRRARLWQKH